MIMKRTRRPPDIAPFKPPYIDPYKYNVPVCPVHQYGFDGKYIKTYHSIGAAARAIGISHAAISNCISENCSQKSAGGFQWVKA